MRQTLPEELAKKVPVPVFTIFEKFRQTGFEIYLVGGAVRDLLLNREIHDADFTTNARPEEIQKIFPESFYDNIFGTVRLMVKTGKDEEKYEITTYRTEMGYTDKRRPDQIFWGKTLEDDLKRRELTINAMVIGPTREQPLELVDLFGGQEDLGKKIIRAVGNPDERFSEDALRMMRAIRFASQLGFAIEPKTFAAIQKNAKLIKFISWERIRDELLGILASDFPSDGITLLYSACLLEYILPELIPAYGVAQAKHHIYDVWTHSLMSLKSTPSQDPLVRLATLIHDIGKPVVAKGIGEARTFHNHEVVGAHLAEKIARRLKFSKKDEEKLVTLVRRHQFTVDERQTDAAIRRFIRNVGKENLADILALRIGDRLGGGAKETSWRLEKFKKRLEEVQKQPFTVADIKVNGFDVMKILGLKPGPEIGKILNRLFEEVVEKKTPNEREALLKRLKEIKL
ncbi:MAG TPA: HD domain-containing protein [Patescibacteria group bacterium]|nr:HD domain-containing protein [Patescibacteria group bacterium]